ncbi:hypothetical protein H2248_009484 [Termitomyces sp. 'cryptogamus']|nr:hypothetical protein H2248_009484 [Termitomyces sp. 'cryptogamus']
MHRFRSAMRQTQTQTPFLATKQKFGAEKAAEQKASFRDAAIPHYFVRLVESDTGKLTPLQPLTSILATIDPRSHYLELIHDRQARASHQNFRPRSSTAAEAAHKIRQVAQLSFHCTITAADENLTETNSIKPKLFLSDGEEKEVTSTSRQAPHSRHIMKYKFNA